jgi:hypothetical protein
MEQTDTRDTYRKIQQDLVKSRILKTKEKGELRLGQDFESGWLED